MVKDLNLENFSSMIDNMITGICFMEHERGKLTPFFINEGFFRMLGYSRTQGMKFFQDVRRSLIPDDLPVFEHAIDEVLQDNGSVEVEFRTVTGSGGLRWLHAQGNLYSREGGKEIILAVIQDITERKSIEEELRQQAERLHILSEAEGEKIIDYNAKTDVLIIKTSAVGYSSDKDIILNRYLQNFTGDKMAAEDRECYRNVLEGLLKSPKHDSVEFRTNRFEKGYRWYQANLTSLLGSEGYVTRIVGRMLNIHERKLKELDLLLRAEKDALTGLYNKGATVQLIENAIAECKGDGLNALMIIDLDNFKTVNDTLGHAQGDKVLVDTAAALSSIFKGGDIVGRIGGDEFVVYMQNLNSISNADILATKVVNKLDFKLPNGDAVINVTCSIGVAIYPYHGTVYEELFNKADKAVYTAKANGKNGYRIYDAATTMAYHANRRDSVYNPDRGMEMNKNIEDLVMQILFEDKQVESALKSSMELMISRYKFHRAYLCGNEELADLKNVFFAADGYEMGKESQEHYELRRIVSEVLYESYKNFAIIHDYDLPANELHDYLQAEGIRSMLYYPVTVQGQFKGAIVFENHEDVQMEFPEGEMEEIRSLLRIIEAHVLQIGLMDRLQDFVTQIAVFDNMDNYIYIINEDTYAISFINKKVLMKTPEVKIGDICYKALQHRDSPCENCILKKLDPKDPHSRCTEEMFNYSLRCWSRCSASWLEHKEDNRLALVSAIDISEYFIG